MKKNIGCLVAGCALLILPIAAIGGLRWKASRPKAILRDFLGADPDFKFTRVESEMSFSGPFEEEVHLYLEAAPAVIRSVLVQGGFELSYLELDYNQEHRPSTAPLEFKNAPAAADDVSRFYKRRRSGVSESVGVSSDYSRLWYGGETY